MVRRLSLGTALPSPCGLSARAFLLAAALPWGGLWNRGAISSLFPRFVSGLQLAGRHGGLFRRQVFGLGNVGAQVVELGLALTDFQKLPAPLCHGPRA